MCCVGVSSCWKRWVTGGMIWKGTFPSLALSFSFCFLAAMMGAVFQPPQAFLPCLSALEPADHGLELLKLRAKQSFPPLSCGCQVCVSVMRKGLRQISEVIILPVQDGEFHALHPVP